MASVPKNDPYVELESRAARLGMEPKVFLDMLLDDEERDLLLQLEKSREDLVAGRTVAAENVYADIQKIIQKKTQGV